MAKITANIKVWGHSENRSTKGIDEQRPDRKSDFDVNVNFELDIDDSLIKRVESSMIERKLDSIITLLKEKFSRKDYGKECHKSID